MLYHAFSRMARIGVLFTLATAIHAQALLVDRASGVGTAWVGVPKGFIGDHFSVGSAGDVWVIDALSVWVKSEDPAARLGDIYESMKLLGGIEAQLPAAGEPAQPDCACHNLAVLKSGLLRSHANAATTADIRISAAGPGIWRIDFDDLKWSIPGGVPIQFGVLGTGRSGGGRHAWLNSAISDTSSHDLRLFDDSGRLLGRYNSESAPRDGGVGFNIQVRGHKSVPVAVRSEGGTLEMVLRAGNGFDPRQANPDTLRIGPNKALPAAIQEWTGQGSKELVLQFRRDEIGSRPGELTVCVTGLERNGIPFEGCDVLPKR